jgi:hypothetical protein
MLSVNTVRYCGLKFGVCPAVFSCEAVNGKRFYCGLKLPDHDQQHCYHHAPTVKPEAATAVVELLMMGLRTPETC